MDFDDLEDAEGTAAAEAVEQCSDRRPVAWGGRVCGEGKCSVFQGPGVQVSAGHDLPAGSDVTVVEEASVGGERYLRIRRGHCDGWLPAGHVQPAQLAFPGADCDEVSELVVPAGRRLRLYLASDVHVDHRQNKEWLLGCLAQLDRGERFYNCLLLPGDVCHLEELFEEVMAALAAAFEHVFFCFGNHEAWTKGEPKGAEPAGDSLEKLRRIHGICQRLGIYTSPVRLRQEASQALLLLPLWSWYHSSWDTEPDLPSELRLPVEPGSRVMDYRMCKWGRELEQESGFSFGDENGRTSPVLAKHFAKRNEAWMRNVTSLVERDGGQVLTFSHFCPRLELILEKRNTYDQFLPKVSGSTFLEKQIRSLQPAPACHVFGHTHVAWDMVLDGLRYVHWPLGNPSERAGQTRSQSDGGLLLLRDGDQWAPRQFLHWSHHYDGLGGRRWPGAVDLAPWVSAGYVRTYPEMVRRLEAEGLLKEPDAVDGYAAYFPGGLENNSSEWWARHEGENLRWRCPPKPREPREFPCEQPDCLLCRHNLQAAAAAVQGP